MYSSMNKKGKVKENYVGEFEIKSGSVVVSDPCYDLNQSIDCMGVLNNVEKGKWIAYSYTKKEGDWGERVNDIIVYSKDSFNKLIEDKWELEKFEVGVDSGQAGIFDKEHYQDQSIVKDGMPQTDFINDDK